MTEELKINLARVGKRKIKKTSQDISEGQGLMEKLGITDSDKENIFDLIEKELEDF